MRNLSHGVPGTPDPYSLHEEGQQSFLSVTCVSVIALFMNEWPEDLDEDPDIVEDMAVVLWNISRNIELTICSQFFVYDGSVTTTTTTSTTTMAPTTVEGHHVGVNGDAVVAGADAHFDFGNGERSEEKDAPREGGERGGRDQQGGNADERGTGGTDGRCGFTTVALKLMSGIFYRLQPETAESSAVVSRTLDSLGRIFHVAENRQLFMRTILHDPELRLADILVHSLRVEATSVVAAAVRLLMALLDIGDSAIGNYLLEDVRVFVARDMRIIAELMRIALCAGTIAHKSAAAPNASSESASIGLDVCRQAAVVIQRLSASHVSRQCVLPYESDALEGAMCSDRETASTFCFVLQNLSKLPNVSP